MVGEGSTPETADLSPHATFDDEITVWAAHARGQGTEPQHPIDELLAEHHLMEFTLSAMCAEVQRLANRAPLRIDVWADVVDFMGNFVHLVHRRKETLCLKAILADPDVGETPALKRTAAEHARIERLTVSIVEAANGGDWEGVLRAAHQYLAITRPHLRAEESGLFPLCRQHLTPEQLERLQEDFARVEAQVLGDRGRLHYLDLTQRLVQVAELPLDPVVCGPPETRV